MKLLITGADGQLGRCLRDACSEHTDIQPIFLTRHELDLSDSKSVDGVIGHYQPDWLINGAAYTAVDRAESEPDTAHQVNAVAPRSLAQQCSALGIPMLQVSTDYVFRGDGVTPYQTDDLVDPLGVYASTKAEGERAVRESCKQHIILRTAWVYSEYGNNFLKTMLRLAQDHEELRVVADQKGSPTYAGDIANAILKIVGSDNLVWGTYHYTGSPIVGWDQFAKSIFKIGQELGLVDHEIRVEGIKTEEYPTPAARPHWSALDGSKTQKNFGIESVNYNISTRLVLQKLLDPAQN